MSLDSAGSMFVAWVALPLLMCVVAAGLGALVARVAGRSLGAMTLPAGFAAGAAGVTVLLQLGLRGEIAGFAMAGAALAGLVLLVRRRSPPSLESVILMACAVAVYLVALGPVLVSGRVAILGYFLNNDTAIHLSAIELLREHGTAPSGLPASSFASVDGLVGIGYPAGGYGWPLIVGAVTRADTFAFWTPMLAWHLSLMGLVAYALLARSGVPPRWAAPLGGLAGMGYLSYAYYAQGGLKETATAVCVYGFAAVLLDRDRTNPLRRWVAAGVLAAGAVSIFGIGAGAWLGPIAVIGLVVSLFGARRRLPRPRVVAVAAAALAALLVVGVPLLQQSINFVNASDETLRNPAQAGNLLGEIPWRESLNIWFTRDYRVLPTDEPTLTDVGWIFALVLAVVGLGWLLVRRQWAIVSCVAAGTVATHVITARYSIYLDAKALAILSPILGVLTASGIWALGSRNQAIRAVLSAAFGIGVLASAFYLYRGAWISPHERIKEMSALNERYAGQGPILINEREQYAMYLMRDVAPWESWGPYQPERGFAAGELFPEPPPHTPDFDDYRLSFVEKFPLLLERRRPGGSRPPSNYRVVDETTHYRIWKRTSGPAPAQHVALGADEDSGADRIDCEAPEFRALLVTARRRKADLLVRAAGPRLTTVSRARDWGGYLGYPVPPPVGMITRFGGGSDRELELPPGRYTAWIQGSFGPGARLYVDGSLIGRVHDDLGSPDGWKSFGAVTVSRERTRVLVLGAVERRWRPGGGHFDISGSTVFVRDGGEATTRRVPPHQAPELCGELADWVELA